MENSPFKDIEVFSEVLQDGAFDLIDAGIVKFAAGNSFSLSFKETRGITSRGFREI